MEIGCNGLLLVMRKESRVRLEGKRKPNERKLLLKVSKAFISMARAWKVVLILYDTSVWKISEVG